MSDVSKEIQRKLDKLAALEAGGVDNWEWYGESLTEWFKNNALDELAESICDEVLEIVCTECRIDEPAGNGCGYAVYDEGKLVEYIRAKFGDIEEAMNDHKD